MSRSESGRCSPVNFTNAIPATLACLSLALALWQWLAARRFPLHQRVTDPSFTPAVTLLKPLKGGDATTAASLQSWFDLDYAGPTQLLFGVADASDPVCKTVRALIDKNPGHDAQLMVCGESLGTNGKISTLIQLERSAKHELILVSDADVRVRADFLVNAVAPLRDDETALVYCFYCLANPVTAAMLWEAIAVNADFWSQVLQAASLKPLDFALGATMLVRRPALAEIGGLNSLVDCLADDYQLGHRLAETGHRLALCPVVVECWDAPMTWRDVWQHQLRWARTIRCCRPLPYFFSILSNATLWPLLWFSVSLISPARPGPALAAIACLLIRICLARNLQRRLTPDRQLVSPFWLVPVKDLLQIVLWFGAFLGRTVEWRGQRMKLHRDGTLRAEP